VANDTTPVGVACLIIIVQTYYCLKQPVDEDCSLIESANTCLNPVDRLFMIALLTLLSAIHERLTTPR